MPENRTFKVGKDVFDIPESEVSSFMKDMPDAVEVKSFVSGKDTFDIPVSDVNDFVKDMPQAKPLDISKKKVSTEPSQTGGIPLASAVPFTENPYDALKAQLPQSNPKDYSQDVVNETIRKSLVDAGTKSDLLQQSNPNSKNNLNVFFNTLKAKGFSQDQIDKAVQAMPDIYNNPQRINLKGYVENEPEKPETGYITGTATEFNKQFSDKVIGGMDKAAKFISDMTGLSYGGGFKDVKNQFDESFVKNRTELPDGIGGDVLKQLTAIAPDMMMTIAAPEIKLNALSQMTGGIIKSVPKFSFVLGGENFLNQYDATAGKGMPKIERLSEALKAGGEGAKEGLLLDMMGYSHKGITEMLKPALGKLGAAAAGTGANATMFGMYDAANQLANTGKIDKSQVASSMALAGVFGLPELTEHLYNKAVGNFLTTPAALLHDQLAQAEKIDISELRKQAEEKANSDNDADHVVAQGLNNVADNIAIGRNIIHNPSVYLQQIQDQVQSGNLTPDEGKFYIDKINKFVANNDPVLQQIKPISDKISQLDGQKQAIEQNQFIEPAVKEVQLKLIDENKKQLQNQISETLKPKENAETVRSNAGQVQETGTAAETSQDKSSKNLQRRTQEEAKPAEVKQQTQGEIKPEYKVQHKIKEPITTADNLTGNKAAPEDLWENINDYHDINEPETKQSYRILKSIQGNPDAEVTIYRAVPNNVSEINKGDWITLSKKYADAETEDTNTPKVISLKVKASDIGWDGNDLNEFAYFPKEILPEKPQESKAQLTKTESNVKEQKPEKGAKEKAINEENGNVQKGQNDGQKDDEKVLTGEGGAVSPAETELQREANKIEAKQAVDKKAKELLNKNKETNIKLKEQKKDLIEQLTEIENTLWKNNPDKEALREGYLKGRYTIPFEESDLGLVKKLGYKVGDDGKINIHVKDDGNFKIHYSSVIDAIERIKKDFPTKIEEKPTIKTPSGGERITVEQKALNRGSFEKNQEIYDLAKENLETAKKSGNKKLQETFSIEFEKENKILEAAKKIDWAEEKAKQEMSENNEVKAWIDEYENSGYKSYYNELGFYGFNVNQYIKAKELGLLNKGYSFEEVRTLLDADSEGMSLDKYRDFLEKQKTESETEQKEKFGLKKGEGFRKPKNNNEQWQFKKLEDKINSSQGKLEILNKIEKRKSEYTQPTPSTLIKFKTASDLYNRIKEADGAAKKRTLKAERDKFLKDNPTIKRIDDNIKSITKQLEEQGLLKKKGDCP